MNRVLPAPYRPEMPLASAERSFCKVVAPNREEWRQLAHRFCVRVGEYIWTQPEQVTPDALTDEDYAQFHLVLFGSILDNPAILRLYVRHRCFTDAAYPGLGGAEIRSVVNPLGTGKNVLLVGGTDFASVNEAAIGFHRSFSQVTFEREGVLWVHPLDFSVSSANARWSGGEPEAFARRLCESPTERFHRLADCALYHYQSGDAEWAEVIIRALPTLRRLRTTEGLEKFVLAWTLIYWSRVFSDAFRLETDEWLREVGSQLIEQGAAEVPNDAVSFWKATALHRIRAHFLSLHGVDPFDGTPDVLPNAETIRAADGFRDWRATDEWLSRLFESERYDAVEAYDLAALARDALATVDNRKVPLGDPENHRHARNVLAKIAAFENDGRYVWLQRWLGSNTDESLPLPRPEETWTWYTGRYASDLLPRPPSSLPTVEVVGWDKTTGHFDGIAFRRGFEPKTEYLFLSRGGAVQRLTANGVAWVVGGSWTETPATLLRTGELPDYGYCALDCGAYQRRLLWRHGEFFLLFDRWTAPDRYLAETRWSSDGTVECRGDEWKIATGSHLLRLISADGTALSVWDARAQATKGVVLTFDTGIPVKRMEEERIRVGEITCSLGGGGWTKGGDAVECDALAWEGGRLVCFGLRRLRVGGVAVLNAAEAVDLSIRLSEGRGLLRVGCPTALSWRELAGCVTERTYPSGAHEVFFADVGWARLADGLEGDGSSKSS